MVVKNDSFSLRQESILTVSEKRGIEKNIQSRGGKINRELEEMRNTVFYGIPSFKKVFTRATV